MAHHPRIGERPTAATTEAAMSRSEQAGVDPADQDVSTALAEGNRAYEEKFGRVFLIRAAGRTRPGNPGRPSGTPHPHPRRRRHNSGPASCGRSPAAPSGLIAK